MFLALVLFADAASAEVCRGSQIPPAGLRRHDGAALLISTQEILDAERTHLPWGYPSREKRLLYHREFVFRYDVERWVPTWAAYKLERKHLAKRERRNAFCTDPRLLDDESARCADYDEPVFDRGHLVPNADMNRSARAQAHTFFLSNMAPQQAWFNQRLWAHFEDLVRIWAKRHSAVWVISGSAFDRDDDRRPDDVADTPWMQPRRRVGVPTHFYKIVIREREDGRLDALTILLPHMRTGPPRKNEWDQILERHLVSIRDVEQRTGLRFLSELEAADRARVGERWRATCGKRSDERCPGGRDCGRRGCARRCVSGWLRRPPLRLPPLA